MPWHSGKPDIIDLTGNSVGHIKDNFQELEPLVLGKADILALKNAKDDLLALVGSKAALLELVQSKDDLMDLVESAPDLSDLISSKSDLMDLVSNRTHLLTLVNNRVSLMELVDSKGDLLEVATLRPHLPRIMGSLVADDNLDVSNPPNGRYVRWENGLCLCSHSGVATYVNASTLRFTWSFPVAFDSIPIMLGSMTDEGPNDISVSNRNITCRAYSSTRFTGYVAIRTISSESNSFQPGDTKAVTVFAFGVVSW